MKNNRLIPEKTVFPFILLVFLFFLWAVPNNLTDTMLAAFKRIMSLTDSQTAWIQVVCYLLGYGCFAIPAAIYIKKHTYKSGVMLGLALCSIGTILFYPALKANYISSFLSFGLYLFAIFILFAGLSVLETSTNSYVYALGSSATATRRLNFAQSFNPFGALTGVIISQTFVLSNLNTLSAGQRTQISANELLEIQNLELTSVTRTYMVLGLVFLILLFLILLTKMPKTSDELSNEQEFNFKFTFKRLLKNKNYVFGVVTQFFYVGAQIAVWSFIIRYVIEQLNLEQVIIKLGNAPTQDMVIATLRAIEPISEAFYNICNSIGLDALLPRTIEQAGATYYVLSLILFVIARFICTAFMKYIKPVNILSLLSILAVVCSFIVIYSEGPLGVYALILISGCMSLMFPTIYSIGMRGLGEDTKIGGSGMVMAIAGAAVLTQLQGIVSDSTSSIKMAYWVPAIAFIIIAIYSFTIARKKIK